MNVSLSKLQELVMDREACHAAFHGSQELDMTEQLNWTYFIIDSKYVLSCSLLEMQASYEIIYCQKRCIHSY